MLLLFERTNLHDLHVIPKGKMTFSLSATFASNCLNFCNKEKVASRLRITFLTGIHIFFSIGILISNGFAQTSFERSLDVISGAAHTGIKGMELPDSSLLVVGCVADSSTRQKICLLWTNPYGDTLRSVKLQPPALREKAYDALHKVSGEIVVAGSAEDSTSSDALVMQLDAAGNILWRHQQGTSLSNERFNSLSQTQSGNIVAAGRAVRIQTNSYYLKAELLQSNGVVSWSKEWRTRLGEINSVVESPDSSVFFCGYLLDFGDTSGSMFLMKVNAAGDSLWTKKYFGSGWATGNSILILPDGLLIAGATSYSSLLAGDHFLVRTNFNGDTLWTRRIGSVNADEKIVDVAGTPDNCYILCGNAQSNLELIKTDTLGNAEWIHDYNSGDALAKSVCSTRDSGYFAVGSSGLSTGLPFFYLVKTDANGGILLGGTLTEQRPNEIRFYPNPSNGHLHFMPAELFSMEVRDVSGKLIYRRDKCSDAIDLTFLASGAYFLFARSSNGDFMQGKLLLSTER